MRELYRGAVAGVSNSVLVRRGVVCEAASARRVGGNERARQRGRSLARAHRCRRKSHRRSEKSTVWCFTQTEQPPTHWTSVSLATFSTSTEDPVASLSLLCILLRIQERERPAPGGRTPSVSDFRPIRNCRFCLGSAHKVKSQPASPDHPEHSCLSRGHCSHIPARYQSALHRWRASPASLAAGAHHRWLPSSNVEAVACRPAEAGLAISLDGSARLEPQQQAAGQRERIACGLC